MISVDTRHISILEHELDIAGHEEDCVRCQGLRAVREGRCHQVRDGYLITVNECPHVGEFTRMGTFDPSGNHP